jgi:uncharacterized protein YunC (DUF1805 family)
MPKLPKKLATKVKKAEAVTGSGFELLEPGDYVARLSEVEAKLSAQAQNPIWSVVFEDLETLDGQEKPGRQFYNLNLPTSDTPPDGWRDDDPKRDDKWVRYQRRCEGLLKGFFESFGYTVDSDTDEMIGDQAVITVGIRTIQKGPRAGERANEVRGVKSLEDVGVDPTDKDEDDDETNF